ncbi:MAG TPA: homogentisate 1,2-dioxygenase [Mycobacteriales bacterium]
MPYYRRVGQVPPKRHTQFRRDDGSLHAEELMGADGFSAESALLYHLHPPTVLTGATVEQVPDEPLTPAEPLLPRHFRTHDLAVGGDLVTGRRLLAGNADVRISYAAAAGDSPLFRDAVGDQLIFLEAGDGVVESVFGALPVRAGDYVVVPAGVTHRVTVTDGPLRALIVEAVGSHVRPPARYLSPRGQFLEGSLYCERDIRGPVTPLLEPDGPADVLVRRRSGATTTVTRYTYAHHPFDVVGWDGCLYPWALSAHDLQPIAGTLHQPPPVHQTFAGQGFVVCTFVPRLLDFHPDAVPAPYNHSNVDSDEVLFYVDGSFTSRAGSGIGVGSISLHPAGFVHGPQPGAVERSLGVARAEELAVMVDTFAPLLLAPAAKDCEDPSYAWSWAGA